MNRDDIIRRVSYRPHAKTDTFSVAGKVSDSIVERLGPLTENPIMGPLDILNLLTLASALDPSWRTDEQRDEDPMDF